MGSGNPARPFLANHGPSILYVVTVYNNSKCPKPETGLALKNVLHHGAFYLQVSSPSSRQIIVGNALGVGTHPLSLARFPTIMKVGAS